MKIFHPQKFKKRQVPSSGNFLNWMFLTPCLLTLIICAGWPLIRTYVDEDINVSIPKKYRHSLVVGINVKEPIPAPVLAGSKVGTLTYKYGNFSSKEYDLFVHEPVAKLNVFEIVLLKVKSLFSNKRSNIETPIGLDTTSNTK